MDVSDIGKDTHVMEPSSLLLQRSTKKFECYANQDLGSPGKADQLRKSRNIFLATTYKQFSEALNIYHPSHEIYFCP